MVKAFFKPTPSPASACSLDSKSLCINRVRMPPPLLMAVYRTNLTWSPCHQFLFCLVLCCHIQISSSLSTTRSRLHAPWCHRTVGKYNYLICSLAQNIHCLRLLCSRPSLLIGSLRLISWFSWRTPRSSPWLRHFARHFLPILSQGFCKFRNMHVLLRIRHVSQIL